MQDPDGTAPDRFPSDVVQFVLALRAATPRVLVTPTLVAVNVAVFGAMLLGGVGLFDPPVEKLLAWGGNFGPAVAAGEWWRLLTCMFVHAGLLHVFLNMYVLWQVGHLVERLTGNVGFLVLYLFSGLAASLCSLLWHFEVVAVGASGAVFGVFGGLVGLLLRERLTMPSRIRRPLLRDALVFIGANLLLGAAIPFIDHAAHLGGLLAGLGLGAVLAHPLSAAEVQRRGRRIALAAALGIALVAAGVAFVAHRDTLYARAATHLRTGEYSQVIEAMDPVLAGDPENVRARFLRASALLLSEKYEAAIEDLDVVIRLDPRRAFPYALRASAWTGTGHLDRALADYDKAVELEPERPDHYHMRAFVHFRLGDDAAAESDWRRAADLGGDPEAKAGSLENIGLIHLRRQDWQAALDHAQLVDAIRHDMAWNSLFTWIAADQLGRTDTARAAQTTWEAHGSDADVKSLRELLPASLQHYMEARPRP